MYTVTSGLDFMVELLRHRISDPKYSYSNVVQEDSATASGVSNEIFYTSYMPIASGFPTVLRAGRWHYTEYTNDLDAAGKRGYIFSVASGSFRIPNGAILAESGSRVTVSYTWLEEQPYKFSDIELKMYISESIAVVNSCYYDFGYTCTASGINDITISPTPYSSEAAPHIYAKYAAYLLKKELESEGFADRIYVRDINITIDTSKGLADLSKSAKDLLLEFKDIIKYIKNQGIETAFTRIDTYSTLSTPIDYQYNKSYSEETY